MNLDEILLFCTGDPVDGVLGRESRDCLQPGKGRMICISCQKSTRKEKHWGSPADANNVGALLHLPSYISMHLLPLALVLVFHVLYALLPVLLSRAFLFVLVNGPSYDWLIPFKQHLCVTRVCSYWCQRVCRSTTCFLYWTACLNHSSFVRWAFVPVTVIAAVVCVVLIPWYWREAYRMVTNRQLLRTNLRFSNDRHYGNHISLISSFILQQNVFTFNHLQASLC